MKLHFLGGTGMVTGSSFLLETKTTHVLIDCGMFQGKREIAKLNQEPFKFDIEKLDAVIVTHAHIDHLGRLPLLVKRGYQGPIYCTLPTKDLAQLMLADSESINASCVARFIRCSTNHGCRTRQEFGA